VALRRTTAYGAAAAAWRARSTSPLPV